MTIPLHLPRGQRRRIQKRLRKTTNRIEAARCRVLLLLHEGWAVSIIAAVVGCVRATVYRTRYRFETWGEAGLPDLRPQRAPVKATPEVLTTLLSYLDSTPRALGWQRASWTLELLALQLERDTGVQLSVSYIRVLLRAQGCRRGKPRPALRIPVRGRRQVLQQIAQVVATAGPQAEGFYVDEADIPLNPRIGYPYLRRGQQPLILTPGKNEKRYIAGALNARTGTLTSVSAQRKNSHLFVALVEALRRRYRRCTVLPLVLDHCIIHTSRYTLRHLPRLAGRVVLHYLPPYSPEANVIERLWKHLHDHVTRNHQPPTMEALMATVTDFLTAVQPFPGTKVSTPPLAITSVSGGVQAI
jgi:putative transposase